MLNLRAKSKYDKVRKELTRHLCEVAPFDAATTAFLAEVQANWTNSHSIVGGPHSDALKLLGLTPSVTNLVHALTYRLPAYAFTAPNQNKKSIIMAAVQKILLPVTIDGSIHVSDDNHTAIIRCQTNFVYIFTDDTSGLRESIYHMKTKTLPPVDEPPPSTPNAEPGNN